MNSIAVCIPTIPPRRKLLQRALLSVLRQTRQPDQIIITLDDNGYGGSHTRNRALKSVTTEFVAFLDDDDEYLPNHIELCLNAIEKYDVIYSGCNVLDPRGRTKKRHWEWGRFGKEFDPKLLHKHSYIPTSSLVMRTEMVREVGGFTYPQRMKHQDWDLCLKLLDDANAKFKHLPEITWLWHHHNNNTSGRSWVQK